jgi:glycosyltransferase involved in cell wall biosynthesis
MRLLIITQAVDLDDPILGFFHRWIEEFATYADIHVICLRKGRSALPHNVTVHSLGKEHGGNRLLFALRFYSLVWRLRTSYYAVFVHMNPEYVVLGGLLWRLWRKKVALWYVHKSVTWRLRIAALFVDHILTAVSNSISLKSRKVRALGHGIDVDAFPFATNDFDGPIDIRTVSRMSRSKGIHTMLAACDLLANGGMPFRFTAIGGPVTSDDEAYVDELHRSTAHKAHEKSVRFTGPVSHESVPRSLSGAHLFLNMSQTGGLDKAMLEAMLLGIPVMSINPTVRSLLMPYGLFLETDSAERVARGIREFYRRTTDDKQRIARSLRNIVSAEHSLNRLATAILQKLS